MHPSLSRSLLLLACAALPLSAHAVDIQRWHTAEGTQVLLVARHDNPIVDVQISFKGAGAAFNPPGKGEVADFTAAMLTDGTRALDEEAFNVRTNDLAADIGSSSSDEGASIRLRSLSRADVLQPALKLVNQSLTEPRFDAEVFRRRQNQSVTALQQNETDPAFVADRAATLLDYPDHPYGSSARTNAQSLRAVTLADIRAFHRSRYGKNNAIVAVVAISTAAKPKPWSTPCSPACRQKAAAVPPCRPCPSAAPSGATCLLPPNRRKS